MGKWFKEFGDMMWVASVVAGILLYAIGTFATQAALAEKEVNLKSYVDQKHNTVESELSDMKVILDRIDQRVYELQKINKYSSIILTFLFAL